MAYIEQSELTGEIPQKFLVEALDDDGDGRADTAEWEKVAASASEAVDALIGSRYAVPLENPPALVRRAARIFALEILYGRRGVEENPWSDQAKQMRRLLEAVGAGKISLDQSLDQARPAVAVITEPGRTTGSTLST